MRSTALAALLSAYAAVCWAPVVQASPGTPDVEAWLRDSGTRSCELPPEERRSRQVALMAARMVAGGFGRVSWDPRAVLLADAELQARWAERALKEGAFCEDLAGGLRQALENLRKFRSDEARAIAERLGDLHPMLFALTEVARTVPTSQRGGLYYYRTAQGAKLAKGQLNMLRHADEKGTCAPAPSLRADQLTRAVKWLADDPVGADEVAPLSKRNGARCAALERLPELGGTYSPTALLDAIEKRTKELTQLPPDLTNNAPIEELGRLATMIENLGLDTTMRGAKVRTGLLQAIAERRRQGALAVIRQAPMPPGATPDNPLGAHIAALQQMGGELAQRMGTGASRTQARALAQQQAAAMASMPSPAAQRSAPQRERLAAQAACQRDHGQAKRALETWEGMLATLRTSERPTSTLLLDTEVQVASLRQETGHGNAESIQRLEAAMARLETAHTGNRTGAIGVALANAHETLARMCEAAGRKQAARHHAAVARELRTQAEADGKAAMGGLGSFYARLAERMQGDARALERRLTAADREDGATLEALRSATSVDPISLMKLFRLELEAGNPKAAVSALQDAAFGFEATLGALFAGGAAHPGVTDLDWGSIAGMLENLQQVGDVATALAVTGVEPTQTALLAFWLAEQRKGRLFDARSLAPPQNERVLRAWKLARAGRAQRARRVLSAYGAGEPDACEQLEPETRELLELEGKLVAQDGQAAARGALGMAFGGRNYMLGAARDKYEKGRPEAFVRSVQARLGARTRLVSLVRTGGMQASTDIADRFERPRYVAFVVTSSGLESVELGEADAIDRQLASSMRGLRPRGERDLASTKRAMAALATTIYTPWSASAEGADRVLLSLDGQLGALPFAALHDGNDWLGDKHLFVRLHSARDLLRQRRTRPRQTPPLVLIDPVPPVRAPGDLALLAPRHFPSLEGARQEAEALRAAFADARVLVGKEASELALIDAHGPRVLHIASHAVYLDGLARGESSARGTHEIAPGEIAGAAAWLPAAAASPEGERGFMRSLVVLSETPGLGREEGTSDGYVTAYEVLGLDLHGTELVVLSACETALGSDTGMHGWTSLQRAFVTAGAQSVVSSLWQVNDAATAMWMTAFYSALRRGDDRAQAVRRAIEATRKRYPHPFYWAPFTLLDASGETG